MLTVFQPSLLLISWLSSGIEKYSFPFVLPNSVSNSLRKLSSLQPIMDSSEMGCDGGMESTIKLRIDANSFIAPFCYFILNSGSRVSVTTTECIPCFLGGVWGLGFGVWGLGFGVW